MTNLFRFADQAGIRVEYCRLPLNESISVFDSNGDQGDLILMDYSLLEVEERERVHLAHELGHCITGSFYNLFSPRDDRRRYEYRANKWAIKKLVPKDELRTALAAGYRELWELAEKFEVTQPFMELAMAYYQREEYGANAG